MGSGNLSGATGNSHQRLNAHFASLPLSLILPLSAMLSHSTRLALESVFEARVQAPKQRSQKGVLLQERRERRTNPPKAGFWSLRRQSLCCISFSDWCVESNLLRSDHKQMVPVDFNLCLYRTFCAKLNLNTPSCNFNLITFSRFVTWWQSISDKKRLCACSHWKCKYKHCKLARMSKKKLLPYFVFMLA